VAEAREQFENPEEGQRLPMESVTRGLVMVKCVVMNGIMCELAL
jgi:hypothetical protein